MTTAQSTRIPVTIIVAVKNEAKNLDRCLSGLERAERVLVIDSSSVDGTQEIAARRGAEVVQFRYLGGYPKKRQWALDTIPISTDWILMLDADERMTPALWDEIALAVDSPAAPDAFLIQKAFHFLGRRFRFGGFSFAAILLFRHRCARYERLVDEDPSGLDMEVHERVIVERRIGRLRQPLLHEDFKGLEAYLERHNKYSTWEASLRARYFETGSWGLEGVKPKLFGNTQERRRLLKLIAIRIPIEAELWFLYHYLLCLGFLEGIPGLIACRIRSNYIRQIRWKVYELRIGQKAGLV